MKVIKAIAIYEIMGFALGLLNSINVLLDDRVNGIGTIITLVFILLYASLGLAGFLLLKQNKNGIIISYLMQGLQVVRFSVGGVKFIFGAGTAIFIGVTNSLLHYELSLFNVQFSLGFNILETFFLVNIIPIIIMFLLTKINAKALK